MECSCLWIRDSKLLTEVLDVTPPFLRNHAHQGQVTDYRNWGLTLGRRFRSLKVLFMLKSHGVSGFQSHLRRSIDIATALEDRIKADDRFELVTPRSLALVVFRMKVAASASRPSESGTSSPEETKLDAANRSLYKKLHARTDMQLSG